MRLRIGDSIHDIDLAIFDCDGVLLDTMQAKIKAFQVWVPERLEHLRDPFMEYIMNSFGQHRSYHIDYFYRDLAGESPSPEFLDEEVERFTSICEPLCAAAPWREGSREFVQACRDAGIARHVLSGTPQAPLEAMLAANDALGLFDRVLGSPPGKSESLGRLIADAEAAPERAIFVGDANNDALAARHAGVPFIYLPSEANRPDAPIAAEVGDLRELLPDPG